MPDTQTNQAGSIFKDRNYNPFANRPMKKKVHMDGMSLSLIHGVNPTQRSRFRTENFYRNATFIMTMFMAGVGISTLTLLGVYGNVGHNTNVARLNKIVNSNVAYIYSESNSSVSTNSPIMAEENPAVLGAENQNENSAMGEGFSIDGEGDFKAGEFTEVLVLRPNGNEKKVLYIKDDISKFEIESPSKFYMKGGWIAIPFDLNGEARFQVKPTNQNNFILNMFSDTSLFVNEYTNGDIGYLSIDAK